MKNMLDTLVILSPGFPENEADTTCLPAQQVFIRALNKEYPGLKIIILAFNYPFTRTAYTWFGNTVIPFAGRNRGKMTRLLVWARAWKVSRSTTS